MRSELLYDEFGKEDSIFVVDLAGDRGRTQQVIMREEGAEFSRPSLSSDGRWLGFSRASTLYLFDRVSMRLSSLGEGRQPVLSPTGDRMCYATAQGQLVIRDLGSGENQMIPDTLIGAPTWSPDGRRVLYSRAQRISEWANSELVVRDLNSGRVEVVAEEFNLGSTKWWIVR